MGDIAAIPRLLKIVASAPKSTRKIKKQEIAAVLLSVVASEQCCATRFNASPAVIAAK